MYLTENLLFATLLVAALLPLVGVALRGSRWRVHVLGLGIVALVLGAATVRRPAEDVVLARALPAPTEQDGMLSSSSCRGCHPGQYASWYASFHRTMTQPARPNTVAAPFDGRRLEGRGRAFVVERRGDEFWFTEVQPGQMSPTVEIAPAKRIVMTTGSHHQQIYWTPGPGGSLKQFAWVYEIADGIWIPSEDSFLRPPTLGQHQTTWNKDCIRCHSAGPRPNFDFTSRQWETEVAELGIACASCHGPSEAHVRAHHDPIRRHLARASDEADPRIVNPSRLTKERSSQVCGQCHSFARFHEGFHDGIWSSFRAGKDLTEHFDVSVGTKQNNMFWADGTSRIGGREYNSMILSGCYTAGEMTCLSCHSMHSSDPRDQLAASMDGNEACLQCHGQYRERIREHTHHAPGSSGSLCYSCHMPYTSYALLGAARSHRVDSPTASGRTTNERPNACNLCHLDRTLAWTRDHLSEWYGAPGPELEPEHEEVAAAVLWALRGDAGQRSLTAWHMGQPWALEASRDDWVTPYLAHLLTDPYSATRLIAHRSLRRVAPGGALPYDHLGPADERAATSRAQLRQWSEAWIADGAVAPPATLVEVGGRLRPDRFYQLLRQRDDSAIVLAE